MIDRSPPNEIAEAPPSRRQRVGLIAGRSADHLIVGRSVDRRRSCRCAPRARGFGASETNAGRSRPCVRCVLCWLAFPLAPALGSTDSAAVETALFVGFPATVAGSDFSRSCIIGCGSSPSRYGPVQHACCHWPTMRSPGSRTKSVRTCQVLRPRRAGRVLALAYPSVLPSATRTTSAPEMKSLSRLNSLACALPCQRFTTALASDRA